MLTYYNKYLKYKNKYLEYKNKFIGGAFQTEEDKQVRKHSLKNIIDRITYSKIELIFDEIVENKDGKFDSDLLILALGTYNEDYNQFYYQTFLNMYNDNTLYIIVDPNMNIMTHINTFVANYRKKKK